MKTVRESIDKVDSHLFRLSATNQPVSTETIAELNRIRDGLSDDLDQAEADAAFRAAVKELALSFGMNPEQNVIMYLKRRLKLSHGVSDVAAACVDAGIQDGEEPADFIRSLHKANERLQERFEEVQHQLAVKVAAEEDGDAEDVINDFVEQGKLAEKADDIFRYATATFDRVTDAQSSAAIAATAGVVAAIAAIAGLFF